MKVFIITEGGRKIGFGHITRCISLYEAFSCKGIAPVFIINGDSTVEGLLKDKECKIFDWLKDQKKALSLIEGADIVIIDSYLAPLTFYNKLSKSARLVVYIDDYKRLDYPNGVVINGSVHAENIDYPKKESVTYLIGSRYALLRKELWSVPQKKIKQKIGNIMVAFGGHDVRNMTLRVLRFLNEKHPELVKDIIVGAGFDRANVKAIKDVKGKNVNLVYRPDAGRIKDIMLRADIAISAGGQTLYELARMGLPTVGVCISENQELNLRGFHEFSFLKFVGWYNEDDLENNIIKAIEGFSKKEERKKSSSIGRRLIDGEGPKRTIEHILNLV